MSRVPLLLGLVAAAPAWAQTSSLVVPDATWAVEDLTSGSDEDQNDLVLRYNARCVVDDATTDLVAEWIQVVAAAAGASRTNALVLTLPAVPASVATSTDGGVTFTPSCSAGSCAGQVTVTEDVRTLFVGAPGGFVNTEGTPTVPGLPLVVWATFSPGTPTPLDGVGALTCPPPAFAVDRADLVAPIDDDTTLANGQPLAGRFSDYACAGASCPPSGFVSWSWPLERHAVSSVYGAPFLAWLADQTDGTPCTRGVDCVNEDWYRTPEVDFVPGADAGAVAPLPPPPSCFDGDQNADEDDVDCGGQACGPCAPTFTACGTVSSYSTFPDVSVGDPIQITYTFDPGSPDLQAAAGAGQYRQYVSGGQSATVTFGAQTVTATGFYDLIVQDNAPSSDCGGAPVDGYSWNLEGFNDTSFQLLSCDPSFVASEALPTTPPALVAADRTNYARLTVASCGAAYDDCLLGSGPFCPPGDEFCCQMFACDQYQAQGVLTAFVSGTTCP